MFHRRFPEALRKLDQVLDITPDDPVALALKAGVAQMEGDLPRAAALLAPLHPNPDQTQVLEIQIYQAILERRPAPIIARLKEVLAQPDPALGYLNGELRFCLGWAQQVAGDHAAAQETWRQARSELESFLKDQPENYSLKGDLALTDMGLGDKAAALALTEHAITENPIEKDVNIGPRPIEILARVQRRQESPTARSPLYKNCSQFRKVPDSGFPCRLLLSCFSSTPCSIHSGIIRASKNSSPRPRRKRRTNNATRSTQRTFFAELIPSSPFAAHARESLGQIRTLELRNSARFVQSRHSLRMHLTR